MATITIAEGEIEEYQGVTLPVLRWFLNKNIVASDGDTLGKSSLEEGVFYKEVACLVNGNTVTFEEHTIDSTLDATPADATYTVALFTAAGALIQVLFRRLRVPATPTSTTLEDIVVVNQTPITPVPDSAYTTAQTDTLLGNKQPLDSDLTAIAALTTTAYGRALLALADAAAARTALSLGTLATQSGTFSGTSSGTNTGDQTLASLGAAPATPSVNAQTGTTYSLQASDNGKIVTCSNGSGITVTVPSGLGAGFHCQVIQLGAGQVTFSPSSTTINNRQSHTKIAGQYGIAVLSAYASDVFALGGDTAS